MQHWVMPFLRAAKPEMLQSASHAPSPESQEDAQGPNSWLVISGSWFAGGRSLVAVGVILWLLQTTGPASLVAFYPLILPD